MSRQELVRKHRQRLTFANVVSVIALFLALGLGSTWAATELSKNEVKSKHIGKRQVKAKDLGKNAVTSPKVADGSLLGEDFAPGELPQGPPGAAGANGATQVLTRRAAFGNEGVGNVATARCDPGEVATGGGYDLQGNAATTRAGTSYPVPSRADTVPTGWEAVVDGGTAPYAGGAYVICASP